MSPIGLCKDPRLAHGQRNLEFWNRKIPHLDVWDSRWAIIGSRFDPQHLPTLNFTHADNFMNVFTQKKKGHYRLLSDFFYSDWHKQKKINVSGMNLGLLSVLTVNHISSFWNQVCQPLLAKWQNAGFCYFCVCLLFETGNSEHLHAFDSKNNTSKISWLSDSSAALWDGWSYSERGGSVMSAFRFNRTTLKHNTDQLEEEKSTPMHTSYN